MKLGISSSLAHVSPEEWAVKQKREGCECVVFPLSCKDKETDIAAYERAAKLNGLQIAEVGIWRNALAVKELFRWSITQSWQTGKIRKCR